MHPLTFCPGEPFSPSKPAAPWVEQKIETAAQNTQRCFPGGAVTAPAAGWGEMLHYEIAKPSEDAFYFLKEVDHFSDTFRNASYPPLKEIRRNR